MLLDGDDEDDNYDEVHLYRATSSIVLSHGPILTHFWIEFLNENGSTRKKNHPFSGGDVPVNG